MKCSAGGGGEIQISGRIWMAIGEGYWCWYEPVLTREGGGRNKLKMERKKGG